MLTTEQATFIVDRAEDCLAEIISQGNYACGHSDLAETIRERFERASDVLAALRGEEVPHA